MPMFDVSCGCGEREVFTHTTIPICPTCHEQPVKLWRACPSILDDTINETIENLAPTPQHFTSRSEKRLYLKQHGLSEKVRHVGLAGGDRSPHTSRWI